ncbi:MAG: hypothetical protein ABF328_01015 [Akkermansiaceae bacterium]
MKVLLSLSLVASTIVTGQTRQDKEEENAFSRLPIGATLTDVSIPRFDEKKRRASLLTAEIMEVKSAEELRGENLVIRLFDKEQKVSGIATVTAADYLVEKEQLIANGELIIRATNGRFLARAQGGILSMNSRQGMLVGQSEIMLLQPEKKKKITMNQIKPILPLLTNIQLLTAATPPTATIEELVEFERLTAPMIAPIFEAPQLLEAAMLAEAKLDQNLTTFTQTTGPKKIAELQKKAPKAHRSFEELFNPAEGQIVAKSDQGFFLDGVNNAASLFGNVILQGRGMTMTCTEGMKILLADPEIEEDHKGDDKDGSPFAKLKGIGEVAQFAANGNISIKGRDKKGQLIEARGDRAVYDAIKKTIIVRGNGVGFRLGGSGFRTTDDNAYVLIRLLGGDNLSVSGQGNWELGISDRFKKKNE